MRLVVLGCSGSAPGPTSAASGYLVQHDGFSLVLDLGNGAFGALQRRVRPIDVDAVLLSHLHPDHCADLYAYQVALAHGPDRRAAPLPVFGPARTAERIAALGQADPLAAVAAPAAGGSPRPPLMDVGDLARAIEEPLRLGPFVVRVARMAHPVTTFGIRVEVPGGPSLAYSGDTGPSAALVDLARGADALLCEASFIPEAPSPPGLHLDGRQAGQHAADAGVGRLIVTHVPPWHSPDAAARWARTTFDGPVEAALDGAVYELG